MEEDDEEDEEQLELQPDEEYVAVAPGYSPKDVYVPPEDALTEHRIQRLKEKRMWEMIWESIIYLFFLWVTILVAYGSRDPLSFVYTEQLRDNFMTDGVKGHYDFRDVRTAEQFYDWAKHVLLPALKASSYTGTEEERRQLAKLRGIVADKTSRVLGYAVVRQIRSKEVDQCKIHPKVEKLIWDCMHSKGILTEDQAMYAVRNGRGWSTEGVEVNRRVEYDYRSWEELRGYPITGRLDTYSGGGYVLPLVIPEIAWNAETVPNSWSKYLNTHFDRLLREGWIDNRTRAVFVEFAVYNAQINMFGVCWLLLESAGTGVFIPWFRFEPVRLYRYEGDFALVVIVCEIVYVLYIMVFMYRESRKLKHLGCREYFSGFWNWIETVIIILSIIAVVFYFARLFSILDINEELVETHGNIYVKLQLASAFDETFVYLIGFVLFLAIIKLLHLFRFNRRLGVFGDTLRKSHKELTGFSVIFTIFFVAFCSTFYLLLSRKLPEFSNYLYVMEEAFSVMLGKFDFQAIVDASSIAPWFFFIFSLLQAMILINMMITIITNWFEEVREDVGKRENEFEVMDTMLMKMRQAAGLPNADMRNRGLEDARRDMSVMDTFDQKLTKFITKLNRRQFGDELDLVALEKTAKSKTRKQRREIKEMVEEQGLD